MELFPQVTKIATSGQYTIFALETVPEFCVLYGVGREEKEISK